MTAVGAGAALQAAGGASPAGPTLLVDRAGRLTEERVFGQKALHRLYHQAAGQWAMRLFLQRRWASWLYGVLQRSPLSRRKIPGFVESLGVNMGEAEKPLEAYRTLDELFTRRLRPDARPLDVDPAHLVSPADGRALAFSPLSGDLLPVKGCAVTAEELLRDRGLAARYAGGAALVIRLAPADYHRFHFPEQGEAGPSRRIAGPLHAVHPIARAAGAPSLRNHRVVTLLETRRFGTLALVEIGALCVGTIVQTYAPGPVRRGQEKGLFRFGGSAMVLLAEPGRLRFDDDLLANTARGLETVIRMGTRIGAAGGPA